MTNEEMRNQLHAWIDQTSELLICKLYYLIKGILGKAV